MHVLQLSGGQIDKRVQQANWATRWTSLRPFRLEDWNNIWGRS